MKERMRMRMPTGRGVSIKMKIVLSLGRDVDELESNSEIVKNHGQEARVLIENNVEIKAPE